MAIKIDRKFIPKTQEAQKFERSFEQAFNAILNSAENYETGRNYVSDYLKALDAKSTETFNHSVNVAAHVYNDMSGRVGENGESVFSRAEVLAYTRAALLHDVGKLTTDIGVLHSHKDLRVPGAENPWSHMMRHSIDGMRLAKEYGFEKEDLFISVSHHVNATSIEGGPEQGFRGATQSRRPWKEQYGDGGVEKILMDNCSWIGEKDKLAAKITHFYDVVEALRSTERRYQTQHDWSKSSLPDRDDSVIGIVNCNISSGEIGKEFENKANMQDFQRNFNSIQSLNLSSFVREQVAQYSRETFVEISDDKIEDIKRDLSCGRSLMEEKRTEKGNAYFTFEDSRLDKPILLAAKKSEPDFERGALEGIEALEVDDTPAMNDIDAILKDAENDVVVGEQMGVVRTFSSEPEEELDDELMCM